MAKVRVTAVFCTMPTELPGNHWNDNLPADERERYAAAWAGYHACRDCRHWNCKPQQAIGTCGLVMTATLIVPEDYTCGRFSDADDAVG